MRARAGTWEHGLTQQEGRLLVQVVPSQSAWSECRQCAAARARRKRACIASSQERESARVCAFFTCAHAQVSCSFGGRGSHVGARQRAPREMPVPLAQWASLAHGARAASAARRAHVGSARAAPPPERETARQCPASAVHAQATSRSEGQGWHVGARPYAAKRAASRSGSALLKRMERAPPARRVANASQARLLRLLPRKRELTRLRFFYLRTCASKLLIWRPRLARRSTAVRRGRRPSRWRSGLP